MLAQLATRVIVLFLLMLGMSALASADKRVALVIGNSGYAYAPDLANPANDAADVSASLERLGFEVTVLTDLSYSGMRRALRNFGRRSHGSDMALIYFAGHGIEVGSQNYLIPVDAQLRSNYDVEFEAIPLDRVMSAVGRAKQLRLVLLDACRNNPFLHSMKIAAGSRAVGRGFGRVEPQVGTLVSYAAKEGTTADDGEGRNSPYTRALLANLEVPGLEINFLFRKVRDSVIRQTDGRQEPFTYGSLPGKRMYLKAPEPQAPKLTRPERDRLAWAEVKDAGNAGVLRHFIKRNPDNLFVGEAQRRLEVLQRREEQAQARLRERIAWDLVKDSARPGALRRYLIQFPDGQFRDKAAARLAALEAGIARKREADEAARLEAEAAVKAEADARREAAEKARAEADARRVEAEKQRAERIRQAAIKAAWQLAGSSSEPAVLEAFAAQYPDSQFAAEARSRAAKLKQRQKIVALQPPSEEPAADEPAQATEDTPKLSKAQLALVMQKELNRVGCNAGRPDGKWGRGSRRALEGFAKHAKLRLASLAPDQDTLDTITRHKSRVCPLACGPRQVEKDGRCIQKTCGRGKELNRKDSCIAKLDNQAKDKKLKCSPRHRLKGNRCVLKTCGRGEELDRRGRCIAKRQQPDRKDQKRIDKKRLDREKAKKAAKSKNAAKNCGRILVGHGIMQGVSTCASFSIRACGKRYISAKKRGIACD